MMTDDAMKEFSILGSILLFFNKNTVCLDSLAINTILLPLSVLETISNCYKILFYSVDDSHDPYCANHGHLWVPHSWLAKVRKS